jgi:hypothetical protein
MSPGEVADKALEPFIKAKGRRDQAAADVVEALGKAAHLFENGWVTKVEVHHARVGVETVEAYGLIITLDANGNAVDVSSPWGFMITEVPES